MLINVRIVQVFVFFVHLQPIVLNALMNIIQMEDYAFLAQPLAEIVQIIQVVLIVQIQIIIQQEMIVFSFLHVLSLAKIVQLRVHVLIASQDTTQMDNLVCSAYFLAKIAWEIRHVLIALIIIILMGYLVFLAKNLVEIVQIQMFVLIVSI